MRIELTNWMLYNVLPPLIFFMSLGGIILVVSRVVLRVRRDAAATELQSHVYQVSKSRLHKVQDLAGILGPNHISVQNFKNRISFIMHGIKENSLRVVADMKDWRKKRFEGKQKIRDEKASEGLIKKSGEVESVKAPIIGTGGITQPNERLRNPLKKLVLKAKGISVKGGGVLKRYTTEVTTSIRTKGAGTEVQDKEDAGVKNELERDEKKIAKTGKEIVPAIRMLEEDRGSGEAVRQLPKELQLKGKVSLKKKEQDKAKGIGKFFKKEQSKSVLEQAKEALEAAKVQEVEDILVPYIVKHPKDMAAYMMLGKAAIRHKNWTEAAEIFEQVALMKPETEGCYAALGEAAYEAGNLTKAIEALQRAHDQNPQDTKIIKQLIKIAARLDNQPMQHSLIEELKSLEKNIVSKDQVG